MYVAMKLHNKIMRDLLKKHNGFEIKTAGDGGFFSFWNGIDALNYLLDFQIELTQQEWPEEILNCPMGRVITDPKTGELLSRGLRVRAGIHVCDPICALDSVTGRMDYHGPSVNRSARVAGSGAGGQIVISQRCYDNVKHLTNELSFVVSDLGIHNFKGLESPEHVYQVVPKMFQGRSFKPLASESPSAIATEESLLSKYQDLSLRLDEVRTNIGASRRTLSNVSMVSGPESARPAGVMHEQSEALFTREDSGTNMVVVEDEELSMDEGDDSDISSNNSVVAGDELRVKNVPDIQLPGISPVPASDNAPSLVTTQLRLGEASEVVRSQILPRHSVETLTDTMTGGSGQVTKRDDFSTDRKAGSRWRTSMAGPASAPTNAGGDDVDSKGRNKWQVMRLAKDILASENKEHHMQEQLLTLANWCKRIIHAYELALAALYAISQNVVARRDTRTSTDAQTAILDQFLRNLKSGSIEGNDSLNFAALLQSENSFLSGVNPSGWMNMLDPSFRAEIARCKNVLKPLLTKVNQMPKRSGSSSNLLNKILSGRPSLAVDGDDDDEANEAEYLELAAIKAEADALSGDGVSEAGSTNKGRRATDLPFAVDPIASLTQQAKEAASPMGPVKGHTPLSASSSMLGLRPGELSSTPDFHLDPSRTNLYSDTNLDGSVRILNPAPWHNQMPEPTTGPRIHPRDPSFDNMRNVIQDELDAFERTRRLLEEQQHADKQFVRFSKPAQPDALEQRARAVQKLNEALAVSKAHERHMAAIKEQMEKELQEEAQRARDVVRPSSSMAVLMTAPRKDAYLPTSAEPKLVRHSTTGGSSANSSKTNSKFRSPSTRPLLSPIPPK
jgi:class 3 adenylate cyclase